MSFLKIKNRAFSTLASGVSDSDTSWTLATGEGAKFPTAGDFHVTCEDEIVKCTSRSTDVLTVVRAQEGTAAAAHTSGKAVELRITAEIIARLQKQLWDADGDTGWDTELVADDDVLRGKVAGTERVAYGDAAGDITANHWLFGSSAGILTTPKQSGAKAYLPTANQVMPTGTATKIMLGAESWDIQNEFNSTVISGTATGGTGGTTLIDSGASFVAGDVGKTVWNTKTADPDEGKSTTIASVDSGTQVTLTADIGIDNTDTYSYGFCRFTATEAGIYFCSACIRYLAMGDAKYVFAIFRVNGATALVDEVWSAAAGGDIYKGVHGFVQLAATDYVELYGLHGHGANRDIVFSETETYAVFQKVA